MNDDVVRGALENHWAASDANDFDAEHRIYRADAVLYRALPVELTGGCSAE